MKITFLLTCLFLTTSIYGQHIFPETQSGCNVSGMSLESNKLKVDYSSLEDLYNDLVHNVDEKYLNKLMGVIMIQVLVDENLAPCCVSISNDSNVSSRKLKLVKNINATTGWKSVDKSKPQRKISALIKLIFQPGSATIQRMGVGGNRVMKVISSKTINRI